MMTTLLPIPPLCVLMTRCVDALHTQHIIILYTKVKWQDEAGLDPSPTRCSAITTPLRLAIVECIPSSFCRARLVGEGVESCTCCCSTANPSLFYGKGSVYYSRQVGVDIIILLSHSKKKSMFQATRPGRLDGLLDLLKPLENLFSSG